jgi:hypothetical protein
MLCLFVVISFDLSLFFCLFVSSGLVKTRAASDPSFTRSNPDVVAEANT